MNGLPFLMHEKEKLMTMQTAKPTNDFVDALIQTGVVTLLLGTALLCCVGVLSIAATLWEQHGTLLLRVLPVIHGLPLAIASATLLISCFPKLGIFKTQDTHHWVGLFFVSLFLATRHGNWYSGQTVLIGIDIIRRFLISTPKATAFWARHPSLAHGFRGGFIVGLVICFAGALDFLPADFSPDHARQLLSAYLSTRL